MMRSSGSILPPKTGSKLSVVQSSNNISQHKNEVFGVSISIVNEKPPKLPNQKESRKKIKRVGLSQPATSQ